MRAAGLGLAVKSLREGSAAVAAATEKKDVEAARTAFKTVTDSCPPVP